MVLAVRASKARAAPPDHGGQHLLFDLVHRLVGYAVPGGRQPTQQLQVSRAGTGPVASPIPTHMTLTLWQSEAPCRHGCCE